MATDREKLVREAAARGKYAPLYRHLLSLWPETEWRAGFGEVERVLGFRLPDSARLHRPWWANSRKGSGHSHALAWQAAGWRTARVDLEAETLVFEREAESPAETGPRRYAEEGGDGMSATDSLREAPATMGLPRRPAGWRPGLDTAETDTRLSSIYEPCALEAILSRYSACLAISARLLDLKAEGGAIRRNSAPGVIPPSPSRDTVSGSPSRAPGGA